MLVRQPACALTLNVEMGLFFFLVAENSAKREENGCNGNPYKICSVRTKGQPLAGETGQEIAVALAP